GPRTQGNNMFTSPQATAGHLELETEGTEGNAVLRFHKILSHTSLNSISTLHGCNGFVSEHTRDSREQALHCRVLCAGWQIIGPYTLYGNRRPHSTSARPYPRHRVPTSPRLL